MQTISHKVQIIPLQEYLEKLQMEPYKDNLEESNDLYYRAGVYKHPSVTFEQNVKEAKEK